MKRSLVLKSRDSVKHSIQSFRNSTKENRDTECILRFSFTKSEKLINLLSMNEGIGNVEFVFSETKVQQSASELYRVVIFADTSVKCSLSNNLFYKFKLVLLWYESRIEMFNSHVLLSSACRAGCNRD